MRICIERATGKLIEMQSKAEDGILIKNALSIGYSEADIEEKEVTEEEYKVILDKQPKEPQSKSEVDVLKEKVELMEQALDELLLGGAL